MHNEARIVQSMEGKGNDEAIEYLNGSQTNSAS
jgi:hypothetical protein